MRQHYTEEQANAILRRAVERMPMKDEMSRAQLESIATELGITPEALQKAEEGWEAEQFEAEERTLYVAFRRKGFLRHLKIYAAVNLLLLVLTGMSGANDAITIFLMSLIGWGVGLAIHAGFALTTHGADFEAGLGRWRIERRARELAAQIVGNPELAQWRAHTRATQIAAEEMKRKPPRL